MARRSTIEIFVEKAKQIHGNSYDYNLVEYKNNYTKIKINCKNHGIFEQRADSHLNGRGCPFCGKSKKYTLERFIEKANKIHNNLYDYSLVDYKNNKTKVIIKCVKCNIKFEQTPDTHLREHGCPKCCSKSISKPEIEWLNNLNIKKEYRHKSITVYEFLGDYWHGNPDKFDLNQVNKIIKKHLANCIKLQ
jgi:Zn finger protein HypA/HybF involved in hydrogenase expression